MQKVTLVEKHYPQFHIMLGKRRVGYVCRGENMPINFLPRKCSGIDLTDDEMTQVAQDVRAQMAQINAEEAKKKHELQKLTHPRRYQHEAVTVNEFDERADTGGE